jgi:ribosomal protein S27AE
MSTGTPPLSTPPKPQAKGLNCPKCGAAIMLRSFGQAETVVCGSCHSILDAKDPNLAILQQFEIKTRDIKPLIPLGTRGKLRGTDYEVIGFQRRSANVDGVTYGWHEYLLFNPYKGFRYLSEYNGHWNDISVCKVLPSADGGSANYLGESYKHFQSTDANTDFVLGEFPWQVRVGERAAVTDYVHPPRVLSCEKLDKEVTWSIGEYMYGREIWDTFKLSGSPPEAIGVYENQPSTVSTNVRDIWIAFAAFTVFLLMMMAGFDMLAKKEPVFDQTFTYDRAEAKGEPSFVTDVFELGGRTSNVEVKTAAAVDNHWIYLNYALINQDTEKAWDFGREVSYYHGHDSDGYWSEGKPTDTVVLPSVPPGHYFLRIEPEVDPTVPLIHYTVEIRRDVPVFGIYGLAFLALLVPAILISWRAYTFERSRWSESDHPPIDFSNLSGSSEDD